MLDFRTKKIIGTLLFYLLWPLVWVYAPLQVRVRVIIRCSNEILVVKNWFGPNSWQLPGGGKKAGESAKDTAIREINEELGVVISIADLKLLTKNVLNINSYGLKFRNQYVFLDLTSKPNLKLSSEIAVAEWTRIKRAPIPEALLPSL